MNNKFQHEYRFYLKNGIIKCDERDYLKKESYTYKDYKDAIKTILWLKLGLTKRLNSKNKEDVIYSIGNNVIILKDYYNSLKVDTDMQKLRVELRKKACRANNLKSYMSFFERNKKVVLITGVAVVLSATMIVGCTNILSGSSDDLSGSKTSYFTDNDDSYEINFECGSNLDKCQKFFSDNKEEDNLIKKYAEYYGVDYNLVRAIAYQESKGNHNVSSNSSAIGIMQIEKIHLGTTIKCQNFKTGENDSIKITDDVLRNKEKNIQIGVMMLRNHLNQFNNNSLLALQAYNFGAEGVKSVLKLAASDRKQDYTYYIDNPSEIDWLLYRQYYEYGGDKKYCEKVMQYCPDTIKVLDKDGNVIVIKFNNTKENKKIM